MSDPGGWSFETMAFSRMVIEILSRHLSADKVEENAAADAVISAGGNVYILEAKYNGPQTRFRLDHVTAQLKEYANSYLVTNGVRPRLLVAVPGPISANYSKLLRERDIDIWDGPRLVEAARAVGYSSPYLSILSRSPDRERSEPVRTLAQRLSALPSGKTHWSAFQTLCGDILEYLFSPPLERAISESANESKVNRRDLIFPNYAKAGFWEFLRNNYVADYVVVDAKNYSNPIKKDQVLQLANYLSRHGTGLFGMLVTRKGASGAALSTRREQWILHNKLILVLDEDDLTQMIEVKDAGREPDIVVRQKVEDFRLSI